MAVIGQSLIGLFICATVKATGANVISVDKNDDRFEYAKRVGFADHRLNSSKEDVVSLIKGLAGGVGVGVEDAFEVVGCEETAQQALEITRKSGSVVLVGVYDSLAKLDIMQIVRKELKVIGSWTESMVFDKTIALLADGMIN